MEFGADGTVAWNRVSAKDVGTWESPGSDEVELRYANLVERCSMSVSGDRLTIRPARCVGWGNVGDEIVLDRKN
jgi:hypothetical protein